MQLRVAEIENCVTVHIRRMQHESTRLTTAASATNGRSRFTTRARQDCVIEFLKSLQVLPPETVHRVIDEHDRPRHWD